MLDYGASWLMLFSCHVAGNPPPVHPRDTAEQSVRKQPCQKWGILTSSSGQSQGPPSTFFTTLLYQIPSTGSLQCSQSCCPKTTIIFSFHSSHSKHLCSIYTFHRYFWHFHLNRKCQNNNSYFASRLIQFPSILQSII